MTETRLHGRFQTSWGYDERRSLTSPSRSAAPFEDAPVTCWSIFRTVDTWENCPLNRVPFSQVALTPNERNGYATAARSGLRFVRLRSLCSYRNLDALVRQSIQSIAIIHTVGCPLGGGRSIHSATGACLNCISFFGADVCRETACRRGIAVYA